MILRMLVAWILMQSTFISISKPQSNKSIEPLKIGERIPDTLINEILSYKASWSKSPAIYQEQLIMLDFWSIFCGSCIQQFPHLMEKQAEYGTRIKIMTVGFNVRKNGEISDFINLRDKLGKKVNLPVIIQKIGDSLFRKLFPFTGFPNVVWIDKRGIFRGVTGASAISNDIIDSVLSNPHYVLPRKPDVRILDSSEQFMLGKYETQIIYGSCISTYKESVAGSGSQMTNKYKRLYFSNSSVFSLYRYAYRPSIKDIEQPSKCILVQTNSKTFYKDEEEYSNKTLVGNELYRFNHENLFCYELILPSSYTDEDVSRYMVQDLDRCFKIKSTIEYRRTPALFLISTSPRRIHNSSHYSHFEYLEDTSQINVRFYNAPISFIVDYLNLNFDSYKVIDASKDTDHFDMTLKPGIRNDISVMRTELRKYGLDLINNLITLPMITLVDANVGR